MLNLTIRRPTAKEKNEQREKRKTRGDYISPRITKTIMPEQFNTETSIPNQKENKNNTTKQDTKTITKHLIVGPRKTFPEDLCGQSRPCVCPEDYRKSSEQILMKFGI